MLVLITMGCSIRGLQGLTRVLQQGCYTCHKGFNGFTGLHMRL